MADEKDESAAKKAPKRATAKRGVPRIDLQTAEGMATKLWDVTRGGETTEAIWAKAIHGDKATGTGGSWRTRVGTMRYFGLVESLPNSQVKLTSLGLQLVKTSDQAGVEAARRTAVLGIKPYEKILRNSSGHELPARAGIVGTFHYDYQLSQEDADKAADDFEASAKLAGLIDDNRNVLYVPADGEEDGKPGESAEQKVEQPEKQTPPPPKDKVEEQPDTTKVDAAKEKQSETPKRDQTADVSPAVVAAAPSVNIKLDMSDWAPDDVLRVLAALGYHKPND